MVSWIVIPRFLIFTGAERLLTETNTLLTTEADTHTRVSEEDSKVTHFVLVEMTLSIYMENTAWSQFGPV